MYRIMILLIALTLVSCASFTEKHSRTMLMDRTTGEMKDCNVDKWRTKESYDKYRDCIKSFEDKGYTVWSQY